MAAGEAARAAEVELTSSRPGVGLRVFFKTETIKLQEVFFDAGEVAAGHAHKEDQAGYIVSGRFEFTLDGTPHELGAGDAYLIPGGVSHGVKGLETGSYVLFSALSTGQQEAPAGDHGHSHDNGHGHDHGGHSHG
ncbi:MAG TPA: cupin domain-containing protein [Candidatus Limnocylindrales bacterium]|nr:cupin domain-containing protein [Candidatus Limnocylindrales bacterium]